MFKDGIFMLAYPLRYAVVPPPSSSPSFLIHTLTSQSGGYVKKRVEVVMPIAIGKEREEIQSKLQVLNWIANGLSLMMSDIVFRSDCHYR
ncbi:hypothetical protein RIF29_42161 [Crotalaria pallida]|uniref:Uncharacterized protein n=1 Tax=Crotalaria pallida TaxID=3830 RepID=A0AAN9E722_CROPI